MKAKKKYLALFLLLPLAGFLLKSQFTPKKIISSFQGTSTRPTVTLITNSSCQNCRKVEALLNSALSGLYDQIDFVPIFYFDQIDNIPAHCATVVPSAQLCPQIYKYYKYTSETDCYTGLQQMLDNCLDPRQYLSFSSTPFFYRSPPSRSTTNQNLRFLCAKNLLNTRQWWEFYTDTTAKCDYSEYDTCWVDHYRNVADNPSDITACFNSQSQNLITAQITQKYQFSTLPLPSILINNIPINITSSLPLTSAVIKKQICMHFINPPSVCND